MSESPTTLAFAHAATVCANLEAGFRDTATRMQTAINDIRAELEIMRGIINEGRAARGLPPLT